MRWIVSVGKTVLISLQTTQVIESFCRRVITLKYPSELKNKSAFLKGSNPIYLREKLLTNCAVTSDRYKGFFFHWKIKRRDVLNYGQLLESVSMKINNRVFHLLSYKKMSSLTFEMTKIWIRSVAY